MWKQAIETSARLIGLDLKHAQRRYFETIEERIGLGCRWLDLGCGRQIVPYWAAPRAEQQSLVGRARHFAGADLDPSMQEHPHLHSRVYARGEQLPFRDGSFDLVTCNMVVEHLEHPDSTFSELRRVIVPGGRVIFHTPNLRYPYVAIASHVGDGLKKSVVRVLEKRNESDVFPTHYQANTVENVEALARRVEMEIERLEVGGSVGSLNELGPLGILELPFLKLLSMPSFNRYNATIIAVLRRP